MFTQFYMLIADGRRPHERPSPRCPPSDPVLVLSTPGCDRVEGMHRLSLPSVHQGSALGQSRKRQGLKKRKMTSSDVLDDITNTSDSDNSDEEIDASMKDKRRRLEHKGSGKLLTSLIQSDRGHAPGQTGVRVRTGNTQSRPTQSLGQDMDMYAGYLWIDSLEQNLLYRIQNMLKPLVNTSHESTKMWEHKRSKHRGHFGYGLGQWEKALHSKYFHWLSTYSDWSLKQNHMSILWPKVWTVTCVWEQHDHRVVCLSVDTDLLCQTCDT